MQKASRYGNFFSRVIVGALLTLPGITPAQAEDLSEVFNTSRQSDPRYRAARYEFEAASFAEPQARAALMPLVTTIGLALYLARQQTAIVSIKLWRVFMTPSSLASIRRTLMPYRQAIQLILVKLPLRHELIHQRNKARVMRWH